MTHLFLIFWKNVYMIQIRRHYFLTMIEIIVPVIMGYMFSYGGLIGHAHKNATQAIYGRMALAPASHGILHVDEVDIWDDEEMSSDAVLRYLNKELMSINGLSETAYWLGNLMGAFFEMFLVQTPLITLFRYDPLTGAEGLWTRSDTTVLVVFFTVYSAAASCFAIIIAIVSPRPNIAAIMTFVVMVMTLILPITILAVSGATLMDRKDPPNPYNLIFQAVCLLPNVGFAYGITLICESEELGSVKPDTGTCFVNGMDVRKMKKAVRHAIGYCPQHFALYREMTVEENLWLFGRIRGMSDHQALDSLQLIVMSFQLQEYKDKLVKRLNTGQKRKLQLGIALIGEPQVGTLHSLLAYGMASW
ncbi:hypothetical protein V5799_008488 [Amblyomma americanum]|uniref:ABC transporter domain-containing protein n=1 Tax=Amblyomma americanum TaxID=6943 RepID=A0AAQ4FDA8_AMBAM